jgi:hypothetical protein
VPTGTVVQGSLQVTSTSTGLVPAGFLGLSYEKDSLNEACFTPSNTDLIALFVLLGKGVLRVGGGTVDQEVWSPGLAGVGPFGYITEASVNNLAGFLQTTGWKCIYGINFATSTPALAAAEVTYVASTLGSSLLGIEIGNATDQYGAPGAYFAGNWSLPQFLTLWGNFVSAIEQAAPGTPIVGPSSSASAASTWTLPFAQAVTSSKVSLLTEEYFRADGSSPAATAEFLISPDPELNTYLSTIETGSRPLGIPYRMAGCNSFYSGGAPGVSDSYASSLWVLDFLFSAAQGGATGVNMHGGGQIHYTPIMDSNGFVSAVAPEYHGLLLFSLASTGTLMQTQFSAGSLNASAYAVKAANGGLNLIVVNKDSTQNLNISVSAGQTIHTSTLLAMAAPQATGLAALSGVTIQGATVNIDGSFAPSSAYTLPYSGTTTSCYVPALGAVLINIT